MVGKGNDEAVFVKVAAAGSGESPVAKVVR